MTMVSRFFMYSCMQKQLPRSCSRVGLLSLMLGLMLQLSAATPQQFVSQVARTNCTQHPERNYGQHGDPVPDIRSSINVRPIPEAVQASQGPSTAPTAVSATTSASTLAVCPGTRYAVDINFGGALVNALVTSSAGKLTDASARPGLAVVNDAAEALGLLQLYIAQCPNRYTSPAITRGVSLILEVPVNATEVLTLRATSASGPFDNFRTVRLSLPVTPQQQCNAVLATTPANSTPTIATTPDNSTPVSSAVANITGAFVSTDPLPRTSDSVGTVISTTVQQPITVAAQPLPPTPEEAALLAQIAAANGANDVTTSVTNTGRMASESPVLVPAAALNAAEGKHHHLVLPLMGCVTLFLLH